MRHGDGGGLRLHQETTNSTVKEAASATAEGSTPGGSGGRGSASINVCLANNSSPTLSTNPVTIEAVAAPAVTRSQARPTANVGPRAAANVPKAKVPRSATRSP